MYFLKSKGLVLFACVLLLATQAAYSQLFFTKGYVVLASGDTLKGDIRERGNQLIELRSQGDNAAHDYSPNQLISYQSAEGKRMAVKLTEDGQETAYFMREQINGYVSLYSLFKPEGRLTHALRLPDETFIPLRGNLALLMLTKHLTGCSDPEFTRLLVAQGFYPDNSHYERVVNTYNACINPSQSIKSIKKPFHYEAGLSAGFVQNNWMYNGGVGTYLPYWKPSGVCTPNYTVGFGGFFTVFPQKRLSASIEFLFTHYVGTRYVLIDNPLDPTATDSRLYSFSESYVGFPITGRYVFTNGSTRWYLKGGIVPTLVRSINAKFSGPNIYDADIPIRASAGIGYLVGLGTEIRLGSKQRVYVEARSMPHFVRDGVTNIANSRSFQLMVSVPLIQH